MIHFEKLIIVYDFAFVDQVDDCVSSEFETVENITFQLIVIFFFFVFYIFL